MSVLPYPSKAEMKVCSEEPNVVMVAVLYQEKDAWISEGWWNIQPQECVTIMDRDLHDRYYYLFGINIETGDEWSGDFAFCVDQERFRITDQDSCAEGNALRVGGMEIDTQDRINATVQLN